MNKTLRLSITFTAACVLLASSAANAPAQTGVTQTVEIGNFTVVPGAPANARFDTVFGTAIDAAGQVVLGVQLTQGNGGITLNDDRGLWYFDAGGNLSAIVREGSGGVPGIGGASFATLGPYVVNTAGTLVFSASLVRGAGGVTASNDTGFWQRDSVGNLSLLLREGASAPGVPGAIFDALYTVTNPGLSLNAAGKVAFSGTLLQGTGGVTASNDTGIWGPDSSGNLSLIAREGSAAPGTTGNFLSLADIKIVFNGAGKTAFTANLAQGVGGVDGTNFRGLWGPNAGGNLSLIARQGSGGVPGIAGANFTTFDNPFINSAGKIAFVANLQQGVGGVVASTDTGLWGPDSGGNLSLIAREGSAGVPGVAGANFDTFQNIVVNAASKVAFFATLKDAGAVDVTNDSGIWGPNPAGNLTLIARTGSGGVPNSPGVNFSFLGRTPVMNGVGLTAFSSNLSGAGVTTNTDGGVYLGDGIEVVQVVRKGDVIAGGTVRTLYWGGNGGGEDGRVTTLNDNGQLAFGLELRFPPAFDTIGVFIWTPDLHWRGTAGDSQWDSRTNFTLSLDPASVHRVILDPAANVNITGPAGVTTVKSLTVGGGAGNVRLALAAATTMNVSDGVTLANHGTLSGTGTVVGDVLVSSGGTLSPGIFVGKMPITGNSTWAGGGTYLWEINKGNGTAGSTSGWDLDEVSGALHITAGSGSPFNINLTTLTPANIVGLTDGFDPDVSYNWIIATAASGITGFDELAFNLNRTGVDGNYDGSFAIIHDGNNIDITYTPLPEPSSITLAVVALGGLLVAACCSSRRDRRRRSKALKYLA